MNTSELISRAIKMAEKSTDEKVEDLRKEVLCLKQLVLTLVKEKETNKSLVTCRRCGRKGHWTLSCNAQRDIHGRELGDDSDYNSE